jgi:hypothetical protein
MVTASNSVVNRRGATERRRVPIDAIKSADVYEPPLLVAVGSFGATTFGGPDQEIPEDVMTYPIEG